MRRLAVVLLSALGSQASIASSACPIEHAHYVYSIGKGEAGFSVVKNLKGFVSTLSMHLNLEGKRDLWFMFDQGSARYISLISVTDPAAVGWKPPDPDGGDRPLADQKFFAWDDDLKIHEDVPRPGTSAPKFILLPDLPERLQYGSRQGLVIGSGIFKFVRCDSHTASSLH